MSVHEFMSVYQDVFHPLPVLVASSLALVHWDWIRQQRSVFSLLGRTITLGAVIVGAVGTLIGVHLRTSIDVWQLRRAGFWELDVAMAGLLFGASLVVLLLWTVFGWGRKMRLAAGLLAATAIPYGIISVYWNISGHVVFTLVPTFYLVLQDRRFFPLLFIPLVMIPNRPMVTEHTLAESIGGAILAVICTLPAAGLRRSKQVDPHPSTVS